MKEVQILIRKSLSVVLSLLFIISFICAGIALASEVTLSLVSPSMYYDELGNEICQGTAGADKWVSLKVLDNLGNIVVFDTTQANSSGEYSIAFPLPSSAQVEGVLNVITGYGSTDLASADLRVQGRLFSYSDSGRTTDCDSFNSSARTAYMQGRGYAGTASAPVAYTVAYYDGDGDKQVTESVSCTDGNISSACPLIRPGAKEGEWHAVVYRDSVTSPPATYYQDDPDASYIDVAGEDSFNVDASAIPEFPAAAGPAALAGICLLIYWWIKKRKTAALGSY